MGEDQPDTPVISYASAAYTGTSRRGRVLMLVLAVFAIHALLLFVLNPVLAISPYLGGGLLGTPLGPIGRSGDRDEKILSDHAWYAAAALAVLLLAQWVFLSPKGSWRIGLDSSKPLPLKSAISAAFMGMLLSVGLLASVLELLDWWIPQTTTGGIATPQRFGAVWAVMGAIWVFWAVVFYVHSKSLDRYTAMRRIVRRLIGGTVLELVMAGPAHAWIMYSRGSACYCDRGTWTGISFGTVTALWLFGPGAFLLFLRERKRRQNLI